MNIYLDKYENDFWFLIHSLSFLGWVGLGGG